MQLVLFSLSMFLSAGLLFSIQPMVAKTLLPIYGGTPAVWTVCMLFFQCVMLAAYGYVWLLSLIKGSRLWRTIHTGLLVLSLTALPILFHPMAQEGLPEWAILVSLVAQIGLPLLVVGSTAPLLQFAYSQTKAKYADDPYFLYTASNLGSLIALVSYPWLIERLIGLHYQFQCWTVGYAIYLLLLLVVLYKTQYKPLVTQSKQTPNYSLRTLGCVDNSASQGLRPADEPRDVGS